ncbi:MAG: HlyD family efflux transporter periplasmic adaptor subunit [Pseudomonadota bacterium]
MSGPAWEQVAGLTPRLVADARIHRHSYRGVPWYVVQDGASARHVRLAEGAWRIAGLMNGERTLAEIHAGLQAAHGGDAPDEQAVAGVLAQLQEAELIECEDPDGAPLYHARQRRQAQLRWRRIFASPISQRIPLVDPHNFLTRWLPAVRPLITPAAFVAWLLVVACGVVTAVANWPVIAAGFTADVLRPNNLALLAVAYLVMKALHELGHAFVTRALGGEVHEMGVMLLVFVPVPYVDASSSSAFAPKSWRMAVGAAGIMVELFLSVIALVVWLGVEPGLISDLAFSFMIVGGVSTLLFNGNPLLRFDGYYVLADALEMPNLGARSQAYLGYLVRRYVAGVAEAESPVAAKGERPWFIAYGVASTLYRLAILVVIVLFIAGVYPLAGIVIGCWLAVVQFALPGVRAAQQFASDPALAGHRRRTALLVGVPAAVLMLATLVIPVPAWTNAEGVIWLPQGAQARAGAAGYVVSASAGSGDTVAEGQLLFTLQSEAVQTNLAMLEHRVAEHQARYDLALFHDRGRLEALRQQLERMRAELATAREQADGLNVRSPLAGRLQVDSERRLRGRFVRKGEVLGFISDENAQLTRVVLRQDEIDRVREHTRSVRVRLAGHSSAVYPATVENAVPSATRQLPSAALGTAGGGRVAVTASDPDGITPRDSVFVVDVRLPDHAPRLAAGTRVYLRFEHPAMPLAAQGLRAARQLLLSRFGV